MKLAILMILSSIQVYGQNMFPIQLSFENAKSINVEILQIIAKEVNGEEEFVSFIEDAKAQWLKIDSLHYFIQFPPNGYYVVTTTDKESLKTKSLYVRTANIHLENPISLAANFGNDNMMDIRFNKSKNLYEYCVLIREE